MGGFYSWRHIDLVRPYFDKFYEALPLIYEKSSFKYVEAFVNSLLPRIEIKDSDIVKLVSLKISTPDNCANFAKELNDCIELLIRSKEVREYARQQMN